MNKRKGFTLIELLAVIVILGLLMAIAIPSVTKYITQSRKKTVTSTIGNYIGALVNDVNDLTYTFTGSNTVYAVPIECIALERGGTNPFGAWHQASNAYWAYVLVQYDDQTSSYTYGYTFKDSAGYGLYPTSQSKLNEQGKQIQTGLELSRPKNGKVTTITKVDNWNGFNVNDSTNLVVLVAESEGNVGNGETTCTLQQKGDNYTQAEEEKENLKPEILTVKIDGHSYQFEEGMTWKKWVSSSYNTGGYYISDDGERIYIYDANKGNSTHTFMLMYDCIVVVVSNSLEEEFAIMGSLSYGTVHVDDMIFKEIDYQLNENGSSQGSGFYDISQYTKDHYLKVETDGTLSYIKLK